MQPEDDTMHVHFVQNPDWEILFTLLITEIVSIMIYCAAGLKEPYKLFPYLKSEQEHLAVNADCNIWNDNAIYNGFRFWDNKILGIYSLEIFGEGGNIDEKERWKENEDSE